MMSTMMSNVGTVIQDLGRENAFCSAVRDGRIEEVAQMLRAKCDPNSSSDYDLRYMTALERAVDELHIGIAALLFAHGADPANNVYQGEEPDQASFYGHKPMDVRPGFEDAFRKEEPIAGFPGLHALLQVNSGEPGCKRMRSILPLMEASMAHKWDNTLFRHLRIGFGADYTFRTRARLRCVLLCLKRKLLMAVNVYFTSELAAFVLLEDVDATFQALAQTNRKLDEDPTDDDHESCDHGPIGGDLEPCSSSFVGGPDTSPAASVVQDVHHDDQAVVIHPVEAAMVAAEIEAGFTERLGAPRATGFDEVVHEIPESAHGGDPYPDIDTASPFSRLVLLNFSRHPRSFETGLMHDECLREAREALDRSGLDLRLQNGAFVFVKPDEYPVAMRAVAGKKLTASHVIVSEALEPVVKAAVNSATSHRDNVRVREVQDLAYAGEDPVIVERTFLNIPRALRSPEEITNSTTAAHGGANPRRAS